MIKVEDLYPLILEAFEANMTFKMPVKGTSMVPLWHTGDVVELDKIDEIKKHDIIFYKRANGQYVLHRVHKIKDDVIFMVGDHQTQLEQVSRSMCFAKVISYKKKNKTYYLKGFRYKLYLLSLNSFLIRRFYSKCLK